MGLLINPCSYTRPVTCVGTGLFGGIEGEARVGLLSFYERLSLKGPKSSCCYARLWLTSGVEIPYYFNRPSDSYMAP